MKNRVIKDKPEFKGKKEVKRSKSGGKKIQRRGKRGIQEKKEKRKRETQGEQI